MEPRASSECSKRTTHHTHHSDGGWIVALRHSSSLSFLTVRCSALSTALMHTLRYSADSATRTHRRRTADAPPHRLSAVAPPVALSVPAFPPQCFSSSRPLYATSHLRTGHSHAAAAAASAPLPFPSRLSRFYLLLCSSAQRGAAFSSRIALPRLGLVLRSATSLSQATSRRHSFMTLSQQRW